MSVTIAGTIRELVITWGQVSGRCWQDNAPTKATLPYVVIDDSITAGPALEGDGAMLKVRREIQATLFQNGQEYDAALIQSLVDTLDGASLTPTSGRVYGCRVPGWNRLREPDTNIVSVALTISVSHDRSAI